MEREERAVLTALCMVYDGDRLLLQDRVKADWRGMTFPGGHMEKGESFVQGITREMREETGLTIHHPRLCGVKQFQTEDDVRYVVLLFKTASYEGTLTSSAEGEMRWVRRSELGQCALANNFAEILRVFDDDALSEMAYGRAESGEERWLLY
ncbi:MAG: 8-oxo-dGTP diphosphatase [Eubacteriales bacterium]|nr:8-oxo-dGTP diphosphatase [Eubacteriales bacterium]